MAMRRVDGPSYAPTLELTAHLVFHRLPLKLSKTVGQINSIRPTFAWQKIVNA